MRNVRSYLLFSAATIIRVFAMYNPLRIFMGLGGIFLAGGLFLSVRFLFYFLTTGEAGKIQSLILAAVFLITGMMIILVGVIADLIQFNRRLLEDVLERVKKIEYES